MSKRNESDNSAWVNVWNHWGYVQIREYSGPDALAMAKDEARRLLPVYPDSIMVINAEVWNGVRMLSSRTEVY